MMNRCMTRSRRLALGWLLPAVVAGGCDAAEGVEVQPLPPVESATPEGRAGLPTVRATWRFAGWELAEGDTANLDAELPSFGTLALTAQRRDSVGGVYVGDGWRAPVVGEVRRDSVLALVAGLGADDFRYLTARLERDTLWVEMTSLLEPGVWPRGARAGFARDGRAAAGAFVRVRGAPPPRPAPIDTPSVAGAPQPTDTAAAIPAPTPRLGDVRRMAPPAAAILGVERPERPAPPRQPPPRPQIELPEPEFDVPAEPEPRPEPRPEFEPEPTAEPEPQPPAQPQPEPEIPEPEIPLLGEPVAP